MIKVKCPCCNNYIKITKRNGEYIAIPFLDNNHSPTSNELEKLGIEFGILNNKKEVK